MRAKAKAVGFYGGSLRQPGEVFEVTPDFKASWADKVEPPVEKRVEVKKPVTKVSDLV